MICRLGPIGDQDFENHSVIVVGKDVMIVVESFEIVIEVTKAIIPSVTMVSNVVLGLID